MIKYSILFLFLITLLFLGLTTPGPDFFGPRRDPVPDTQKVAHSSHCAGCHGPDASGMALVDAKGNDVNIHDDWQISMMGLSAHDPFWRATLSLETSIYPGAKTSIENTCLKCHAPLGKIQSHLSGLPYSFELMLADSLGLDGVSCSACHQQPAKDLGEGHSGNFTIDTNRLLFGQYPNPVQGPMQIYVGFDPLFGEHIYSSGICAGCHTLITETLDEEGIPTGNFFVEQATYHEWLNSVYPAQGKECQSCHMPFIKDSVVIATDLLALEKRYPYGLHQFFGANTAMLSLMQTNKELLNLPGGSSDAAWDESIANNRISLRNAASIELLSMQIVGDTAHIQLSIKNKTGHKLPSGYPSRLAWLQLIMTDYYTGDTIYKNGLMDAQGNITGRNEPYEPHHEISRSGDEVQIYEMVMSDLSGHLTTRLNAAYEPLKDNRLLPLGFKRIHHSYDTVAVWGDATNDLQYNAESNKGLDLIEYRIPLNGNSGLANLSIHLNYHTFPSRWMEDLFRHDSLEFVGQFKSMYEGYEDFVEVIDDLEVEAIDLSPSAVTGSGEPLNFKIYPNPVLQRNVHFEFPSDPGEDLQVKLIDVNGNILMASPLQNTLLLPEEIPAGLYYFVIYKNGNAISIRSFMVL